MSEIAGQYVMQHPEVVTGAIKAASIVWGIIIVGIILGIIILAATGKKKKNRKSCRTTCTGTCNSKGTCSTGNTPPPPGKKT